MARDNPVLPSGEPGRSFGTGVSWRALTLASVTLALVFLVTLPPCHLATLPSCHGEEDDKVPQLRRLLLSPQRLEEELKRVKEGVLVRLPLAELDTLVERATRAGSRKDPPRLLEARYHATLKEESLIGEGQWKLVHKGPAPGLLNLKPFNLALRQARLPNGDALIAAFDGKIPALLVKPVGEQTVSLDWSARAEAGREGLQFHLEIPACPVALLELDVPAGRHVMVLNDGALLSGPHEAETTDLRRWKIVCGGQRIDIRILPADRSSAAADPTPAPLVRQKTTQKLHPEGLNATFEVTLEGLSRGVRELVCECDPELRLCDVVGPNVEIYSFQTGKGGKSSYLTIRLREAMRSGTWQILCLAPLNSGSGVSPVGGTGVSPVGGTGVSPVGGTGVSPAGGTGVSPVGPIVWRSPSLRLVNGVSRGETLTVWLHPELRIEGWDPGSFRLSSSDIDRKTGSQVLTLVGGGLGPPRRPAARLQSHGVEFRAHQIVWWRCDASGMALTAQIGWDVSQGQLFQLPVQLPAAWRVEKVEMKPDGLLGDWRVGSSAGKATLFVDLAHPLGPRTNTDSERAADTSSRPATLPRTRLPLLTVHLRPGWSGPFTGKTLPLPDAVPLGARFREGALALDCDEQLFHLDVRTKAESSPPDNDGPWGNQLPEYFYRYKRPAGTSDPPVKGTLQVSARPPRLRARCTSEVFAASGRVAVETHLLVETEAGSPETIDLLLSSGGGPWQWLNEETPRGGEAAINRVRSAKRLTSGELSTAAHFLAAQGPLQRTIVLAARPTGERWRLVLARPLRAREKLRLHAQHHVQPHDNRWDVPLPVVLGAARMEGEVTLHLAGTGLVHLHTLGLREAASPAKQSAAPWRSFRYGDSEVGLSLSGPIPGRDRSNVAVIDRARLVTYVGEDGVLRHHFSFQARSWSERFLSLSLPPGARPLTVQIDGRWLPRLIPAAAVEQSSASAGEPLELALPVPARRDGIPGDSLHCFEVVYTRTLPAWIAWQHLDAPTPRLPVAPLAFRRIWRLPPKLAPLYERRYQPLPGTTAETELAALPHHVAELFHLPSSWTRWDPFREDRQAGAREALDDAILKLRGSHAGQKMSLREVVRKAALDYLKDRYDLLIDTRALREAKVGPDTILTIRQLSSNDRRDAGPTTEKDRRDAGPTTENDRRDAGPTTEKDRRDAGPTDETPWAECGLIAVPTRSAILLTTISGRGASLREPLSEELEQALAAAATRGQDPSGRFCSALSWLQPDSIPPAEPAQSPALNFESERPSWSEWEPVAELADDRLIVVRRDFVTGAGLALALLLGLVLAILRRRSVHPRLLLLLLALGLSGLGVLWLPAALRDLAWWPLVAGCAVAVVWYLRAVARKTTNSRSTLSKRKQALSAAAIGGILGLGVLGWHSRAAAPSPATVYLVPAPADAPDKPTVLVPADLLDRLRRLARPVSLVAGGPQAVLLDASYEGQLGKKGEEVEFTAVFSAHCLGDAPSTLTLPLSGVRLVGDVFLDGARAALQSLPAPQAGYSLKVSGRGRHRIELRFRAPVVGTAEDRNVLFTVPPLVRSRLSWRVSAGASEPQVLFKYGAQWTTRDAGGERLQADLGALPRPVHLHWYQPRSAARVTYQAAYLWDLGVKDNQLTAFLRYRVERGAVKTLEVDLPADLEVGSATAQRTVPAAAPAWLTGFRLRDWYVTLAGGKRKLHLRFPYPISGDFQVTLELLPRGPLSSRTALPLPSPHGDNRGKLHYLAYRTGLGLDAQRDTSQNLTLIGTEEFAPNWPGGPRLGADFTGGAYRFPSGKPPKLFLRLQHAPPVRQAEVDLTVKAATRRAELQAVVKLEAPNKDLAAVEWDLPSPRCTIASVSGEDVRTWKQHGSRLLVWLNRTTAATQMRLSGWLPVDERSHLALGALRLHPGGKQYTRLHLLASGDLALVSIQPHKLQKIDIRNPKSERSPDVSDFETRDSSYHLDCQVETAANADARVLTLAEVADRELRFTTIVNYTIRHGELRHIQLRLRSWEEEKVEVQAEHVKLWPSQRRFSGERSWLLPLQPGVTKHYQVTLRGRMPLDKSAVGVPMPEVLVQGVERRDYYLAVAGGELTGQAKGPSLQSLQSPAKKLRPIWPAAAQRLERSGGQAWRVLGSEWQLQLLPQARIAEPDPVRVFLLEQSAAVVDGRRWMHEARCWVYHEAHADLHIDFPAPAHIVTATVDDVEATPRAKSETGDPKRVWLPLPGRSGTRCIRLRWLYDPPEPLDRPRLAPPAVADAIQGTSLTTVMVPPGWEIAHSSATTRLGAGATRQAALALYRADAQLQISQELIRQQRDSAAPEALAASQQRFAHYCRHAQDALDLGADRGDMTGPQGQDLAGWLQTLKGKNRSLKSEIRNSKTEASSPDSDFGFRISDFGQLGGTPMSWRLSPEGEPLDLRLTSRESQRTRQALAASGQWLGGLVVVWILSLLPFLLARLRLFWPEQIAVLAAAGWHVAGLTSVVLLLLVAAVCSRVFLVLRSLRELFRKRRNQPSTMTPGNKALS